MLHDSFVPYIVKSSARRDPRAYLLLLAGAALTVGAVFGPTGSLLRIAALLLFGPATVLFAANIVVTSTALRVDSDGIRIGDDGPFSGWSQIGAVIIEPGGLRWTHRHQPDGSLRNRCRRCGDPVPAEPPTAPTTLAEAYDGACWMRPTFTVVDRDQLAQAMSGSGVPLFTSSDVPWP